MANLSGYDANDYEPAGDYTPIPEADYLAVIIDSEMKIGEGAAAPQELLPIP